MSELVSLSESETEGDLVQQLRALLGAEGDTGRFELVENGRAFSIEYFGGSGSRLVFRAPYPSQPEVALPDPSTAHGSYRSGAQRRLEAVRPMRIELRAEEMDDQTAKVDGVAREFQTGDDAFDREVYIDTETPDEVLRHVFSSADLRDGVRALLREGIRTVSLDDANESITATLSIFASPRHDAERARRLVEGFRGIVRGAVAIAPSEGDRAVDTPTRVLSSASRLAVFLGLASPIVFAMTLPDRCVESTGDGTTIQCASAGCCVAPPMALAFGLPVGLLIGVAAVRAFKGRSDSHRQRVKAVVVCTALTIELSLFVLTLLTRRS